MVAGAHDEGVSLQSLLERNDVPDFATEPGPGHYHVHHSSLGPQPLGKCQSAPSIGFARTGWDSWQKVVVTKEHSKAQGSREGPGHPFHPDHSSIRKYEGTKGPGGSFGAARRPDLSAQLGAAGGTGSPGPNLNLREMTMFGFAAEQCPTGRARAGQGSFGASRRFTKDTKVDGGPGTNDRNDSALRHGVGRSFGIGRGYYDKVVRPGWDKEGQGATSRDVGPPLWSDIQKDGSRSSSMGKAERFPRSHADDGPGPGEYYRTERDMAVNARKGCVISDTKAPCGPKFGKVPKKPRWRTRLATTTAARSGWGYF